MLLLAVLSNLQAFFEGAGYWLLGGLGIGLVIFVHEAGHFLVAKKCDVRVEIFSLGFGPRLFGFHRGETDYRVSLVPIGGYVKMAGDNPGESLENDGRDLPSKSVAQRFAIYSAGVVMNLIFALVTLPIVLAVGVNFHSTEVGNISAGGPAWLAGLRSGDEIIRVDGHHVYDFNDVMAGIALGDSRGVQIEFRRDGEVRSIVVEPSYSDVLGRYVIGIQPSLADTYDIQRGGPAEEAGIRTTEKVLAVNGQSVADSAEFDRLRRENQRPEVELQLEDETGQTRTVQLIAREDPTEIRLIGIQPYQNLVKALRGEAARLGGFLLENDQLRELRLQEQPDAAPVMLVRDADELKKALDIAADSEGLLYALRIERDGVETDLKIPAGVDGSLAEDIAMVQDTESCMVRLLEGYPAESAGLPDDSRILKVNNRPVASWNEIKEEIESSKAIVTLLVQSNGVDLPEIAVNPRVETRLSDFGMLPLLASVERRFGLVEATRVGVAEAGFMLKNVFLTLKKILVRDVSPSNLSGILTIAYVSKSLAASGVPSLFFFLAVLSLNLAFLNVLPIPILDGGHLFFLLVEKIKGSPVSDRVMGYSQLVGLVMVLALLLYVTYQDLLKLLAL